MRCRQGQVGGNLLVFAALGFFGPVRFAVLASVPRILAFAAGCSVLVEVTQYVLNELVHVDKISGGRHPYDGTATAGASAVGYIDQTGRSSGFLRSVGWT